jgi:hypothetical protein
MFLLYVDTNDTPLIITRAIKVIEILTKKINNSAITSLSMCPMNQITIELNVSHANLKRTMAVTSLDEFVPTRIAESFVDLIDELETGEELTFTAYCAYIDEMLAVSAKPLNYRVCKVSVIR